MVFTHNKDFSGRPPAGGRVEAAAGTSPSTVGQQAEGTALGLIIANDRDRRTLAWLRDRVGDAVILEAVGQLAGNRKPYLSNVAKALGVALPDRLEATDRETARKHLAAIRDRLKTL